ncbi:MAG: hypothetical protein KJO07_19915 [Deltaproteobacteria bacterium]|nr:hypothetical protein [Deltaproteobacteria bacterium]
MSGTVAFTAIECPDTDRVSETWLDILDEAGFEYGDDTRVELGIVLPAGDWSVLVVHSLTVGPPDDDLAANHLAELARRLGAQAFHYVNLDDGDYLLEVSQDGTCRRSGFPYLWLPEEDAESVDPNADPRIKVGLLSANEDLSAVFADYAPCEMGHTLCEWAGYGDDMILRTPFEFDGTEVVYELE